MALILIVDDSHAARMSASLHLQAAGHSVIERADGVAGLSAVRSHSPDCVLTDLHMPALSGLELIEEVHSIDASIPCVLMHDGTAALPTELTSSGTRTQAVSKPLVAETLISTISRALTAAPSRLAA